MNQNSPSSLSSQRQWSLDLLRILAAFMVIVQHATPLPQMDAQIGTPVWSAMNVLDNLCIWNVPAFFMISGALFLPAQRPFSTRRLYTKNILRMLTSFLFWGSVYAVVYCVRTNTGRWAFLIQLARGHYHMWYILRIIGLYALTPLLRQITQSKKATEYLLLAGLVFSILIPRALDFLLLFDLPHQDFFSSVQNTYAQLNPYQSLYFVYYYVLGGYLCANPPGKRILRLIYLAGVAGGILTIVLTQWHSLRLGSLSSYFNHLASFNVLAMTAAVFVFFTSTFDRLSLSGRLSRVVLHLSNRSYGVYLVHALFLELFIPVFSSSAPGAVAGILLFSLLVYLAADFISALLSRIPFLGKYIV